MVNKGGWQHLELIHCTLNTKFWYKRSLAQPSTAHLSVNHTRVQPSDSNHVAHDSEFSKITVHNIQYLVYLNIFWNDYEKSKINARRNKFVSCSLIRSHNQEILDLDLFNRLIQQTYSTGIENLSFRGVNWRRNQAFYSRNS